MTIEDELKKYILQRYKSIRNFANTSGIDVPYTTIDGMFKRGIKNASISNVIKLCQVLNISVDELANGHIVPVKNDLIIEYARRMAQLRKEKINYALSYIDYLIELEKEKDK